MSETPTSAALLTWYDQYGRKHLPWQQGRNAYRVWVSEIMLQQTQVATVIPYYERFMARFPTVADLALADEDTVLHHWTGLGYYARARNLHKTARIIHEQYAGHFPGTVDELGALPGIGRSTAGAILALGMNRFAVILDGNVKRVLTRLRCIAGWPDQPKVQKQLWELAQSLTPRERCADYTQAIMDLGATLCSRSRPACGLCPLNDQCEAFRQGRTDDFPERRPGKELPVRSTYMLLFVDHARQRVLLEKRPPQGIWGGLWSFPESDDISAFSPQIHADLLVDHRSARQWNPLRHTFSHFHLDITPVLIPLDAPHVAVREDDRFHWYDLRRPQELGLAAPVKKLLEKLGEDGYAGSGPGP